MPNQQLIDYIRQARTSGMPDADIRTALFGVGWQGPDIEEVLASSVISEAPAASHASKLIVAIISLIIILLLAGGGFAYWWYFLKKPNQQAVEEQQQANNEIQKQSLQEEQLVQQPASKKQPVVISQQESIQDILMKVEKEAPIQSSEMSADPNDPTAIAAIQWSFIDTVRRMRENKTMHVVGEEILDGKPTTIIEYSDIDGGVNFTSKTWIWNEKGVPLKTKTTFYGFGGKVVVREAEVSYSGYIFAKVSDTTLQFMRDMGLSVK